MEHADARAVGVRESGEPRAVLGFWPEHLGRWCMGIAGWGLAC